MKRREFVEKLGMGSAGLAAAAALTNSRAEAAATGTAQHDHTQVEGPLAQATVSFGQWRTVATPVLDRFPNNSPRTANNHKLIPYVATIKAGGAVNFLISGTHQILVYAPGTTLDQIDGTAIIEATPGPPPFPGFVNDPNNRVYRGLDPRPLPQDRAEAVAFPEKGTYLVVCGLVPHFNEGMHGFVKVV
jgi:plastocyanin